jgi:ribonucleoside-diphosphate reductase alpha chain
MYLDTRDIDETMKIYSTAWEKGLKSTYYLHMKPRHTAEQSTVKVNKGEKMGKRGFAAVAKAPAPLEVPVETPVAMAAQAFVNVAAATAVVSEATEKEIESVIETSQVYAHEALRSTAGKGFAAVATPTETPEPFVPLSIQPTLPTAPAHQPVSMTASVSSSAHSAPSAIATATAPVSKPKVMYIMKGGGVSDTAPTDPALLAQCDSCQ